MLQQFHFLRPWWLLLLPLAAWLIYHLAKRGADQSSLWQKVCDPALLDRFLIGSGGSAQRWQWWLLAVGVAMALLALAGPVWQQMAQPVYRQQQALVIVLDLSRSMLAADTKPDRLTHAKQKLSDLLDLRHEGQTALVAYAADAFVITPLTDDVRVIAQQLPVLKPGLMPAQGSRLDLALKQALQLLKNSGVAHGEVLILTDSADRGQKMAADLHHRGHRVSVLGFGSAEGAPIAGASGFVTDRDGNIVVARTDWSALHQLANAGGGLFARTTIDDSDLQQLASLLQPGHAMNSRKKALGVGDQWREEGAWLLLLLLPLAATAFRRGWLLTLLVVGCLLPTPVVALEFSHLWRNSDQQAKQLLDQGKSKQAASKFNDARWKSVAHYRAGDYTKSAQILAGKDDADSDYNRGNALAKVGKLAQAVAAYDQALKKKPTLKDADFNRTLVRKAIKQKQKKKKKGKGKQGAQKNKRDKSDHKGDHKSDHKGDHQKAKKGGSKNAKGKPNSSKQSSQQKRNQAGKKTNTQAGHANDQQQKREKQQSQQQANKNSKSDSDKNKATSLAKPDPKLQLQNEQKQARQQWLRRIPDDPGGLLRRKFQYQYRQRGQHSQEAQRW